MNKEKTKKWLQLIEFPKYELNEDGVIRNKSTKRILKYSYTLSTNPKAYVSLSNDEGKQIKVNIDELVAKYFIVNSNPLQFEYITHKDGNYKNCKASNLEWSLSKPKVGKLELDYDSKPSYYHTFVDLEEFPDSNYEINRLGQLRNKKTKRILKGSVCNSYLAYSLLYKGKVYQCEAHILVAKQFLPNDDKAKTIVNHKDENKSNPCVDNLEWVSASENSRYGSAQEKINLSRQKLVNEYSIEGRFIRTWQSVKKLSEYLETLFPGQRFYQTLRRVIFFNSENKNEEKIQLFNRVFIKYEGVCEDRDFDSRKHKMRKFDEFEMPKYIENSKEYLVNEIYMKSLYLNVLSDLAIKKTILLNREQRQAIKKVIKYLSEN